jgi:hypothetical protein
VGRGGRKSWRRGKSQTVSPCLTTSPGRILLPSATQRSTAPTGSNVKHVLGEIGTPSNPEPQSLDKATAISSQHPKLRDSFRQMLRLRLVPWPLGRVSKISTDLVGVCLHSSANIKRSCLEFLVFIVIIVNCFELWAPLKEGKMLLLYQSLQKLHSCVYRHI